MGNNDNSEYFCISIHMHTATLILGSNEGNRSEFLQQGRNLLASEAGNILRYSGIYETASWGREDLPPHLNQVLMLTTPFDPFSLLSIIQRIENRLGRSRQERWGLRTLDIDMLFFDEEIVQHDRLQIPHPRLQDRKFVLIPLAEIVPDLIHPEFQKTIAILLQECKDTLAVERIGEGI